MTEQESARAIGLELCMLLLDRIRDVLDEELKESRSRRVWGRVVYFWMISPRAH